MPDSFCEAPYTLRRNTIILDKAEPFDAEKIVNSGQIFRYEQQDDEYRIFSADKICRILREDGQTVIRTDAVRYFIRYFDLDTSYQALNNSLLSLRSKPLDAAIAYGSGIRILNQEKFETLISFIVSSNNNIPRIQKILRELCARLGRKKAGYSAFPCVQTMSEQDVSFYYDIGCGYRSAWLRDAAQKCHTGAANLEQFAKLPTGELLKRLGAFQGVGPKVADCAALFAYHRFDVFPVDTWVKKIYQNIFHDAPANHIMRAALLNYFGAYAGLAQQYLFYYYRSTGCPV